MTKVEQTSLAELVENLPESINKKAKRRIVAAFDFAAAAHKEHVRESGERYLDHDLAVAQILLPLDVDSNTLI
ncbi:MAG: HD domain-containing protein, partial [Anaerolineaceae bacterium]